MVQPQNPPRVTLSEWDMRRLYNEGYIKRLERRGKYNVTVKYGKPIGQTRRIPAGSKSVKTRYYEKVSNKQVASFHHYESPKGRRITRFDPKFLLIDGIEYHVRGQLQPEPGRIGNEAINRILKKHGLSAKITYLYHVSEQTKKLFKEQIRDRLVKFGIKEKREWVLAC